ncbi:unnamed protein product [Effrenium voratum]|nr:unnamed protein product [Effrenium voratum]
MQSMPKAPVSLYQSLTQPSNNMLILLVLTAICVVVPLDLTQLIFACLGAFCYYIVQSLQRSIALPSESPRKPKPHFEKADVREVRKLTRRPAPRKLAHVDEKAQTPAAGILGVRRFVLRGETAQHLGRAAARKLRTWAEARRAEPPDGRERRMRRSRAGSGVEGDSFTGDSPRRARLWRWRPRLATVLQDLAAGNLDPAHFRCLRSQNLAGRVHSSVVIFVVGGITLPEIRATHEVAAALPGTQAYIGGSCLLTPRQLVELCEAF